MSAPESPVPQENRRFTARRRHTSADTDENAAEGFLMKSCRVYFNVAGLKGAFILYSPGSRYRRGDVGGGWGVG